MTTAEQYARALFEAAQKKDASRDSLFSNFMEALNRRGHKRLLPRIGAEYEKLVARMELATTRVRVASEGEKAKALAAIRQLPEFKNGEPELVLDSTLISGYIAQGRDFRYDASSRRALIDLYRRLTA